MLVTKDGREKETAANGDAVESVPEPGNQVRTEDFLQNAQKRKYTV